MLRWIFFTVHELHESWLISLYEKGTNFRDMRCVSEISEIPRHKSVENFSPTEIRETKSKLFDRIRGVLCKFLLDLLDLLFPSCCSTLVCQRQIGNVPRYAQLHIVR